MNLRAQVKGLTIFVVTLFLVFSAFSVIGQNVDTDYNDDTVLTVTVQGVQLTYRNITQEGTSAEGGHTILGNNQGDVGTLTNVTLNFTAVGGSSPKIDTVDYFNVTAWFDNGSDDNYYDYYDSQAPVGNFRWKIGLDNSSGVASRDWNLYSTHPNDEVSIVGHELLWANETTQNWTVQLDWGDQIKHASPDPDGRDEMFDTPNTWNVNWTAAQPDFQLNTTWQNEFGIYKYVSVAASHDPTGSGTPGSYVDWDNITEMHSDLVLRSNDRFNVSTQINQTLDNGSDPYVSDGSHVIGINNIRVKTNWTDDAIDTYHSFQNLGEKLYLNTSGYPLGPYYSGNKELIQTQWSVYIPLGQYADVYKTAITYHIDMDETF